MESSTSTSSERRHSVPEIIYTRCKAHLLSEHCKKTQNKLIQTEYKARDTDRGKYNQKNRINRAHCSHNRRRVKRLKRISQNELVDMILKYGHVKLSENLSSKKPYGKCSISKCKDTSVKTDTLNKVFVKLQSFNEGDDFNKIEEQIIGLLNEYPEVQGKSFKEIRNSTNDDPMITDIKLKSSVDPSNNENRLYLSPDFISYESENMDEVISNMHDDGNKVTNQNECNESNNVAGEEFVFYLKGNDTSSEDLQSLIQDSSNTLTTSSNYGLSSYEYSNNVSDRTVSTLSIKSSSSFLEEIIMKNVATETDDVLNIPRTPKIFPLIIETDSLLSEPLRSGYIPNTQMKMISVHFLDSDSENSTVGNKCFAITDQMQQLTCPPCNKSDNLVIYEIENGNGEKNNSNQNEDSNVYPKSLISETKTDDRDTQYSQAEHHLTTQPDSSNTTDNTSTNQMNQTEHNNCTCNPVLGAIAAESYLDLEYPATIPRLSSMPKTYSMVVNASSLNGDCSSDTSEISNPDSLDEDLSKIPPYYNKYDERIVRGDTSTLLLEGKPNKKKVLSFTPYFITLNGDESYTLPTMKCKLPEKIKSRIMNREKQLKKHNREMCKYCSKSNLLKKLMKKRQQIKALQKQKQSIEKAFIIEHKPNICRKYENKSQSIKWEDPKVCQDIFERHTCSNNITVQEIHPNSASKEDEKEQQVFKIQKNQQKEKNGNKNSQQQSYRYHTQRIRNEFTQTSKDKIPNFSKYGTSFTQTSIEEDKENEKNIGSIEVSQKKVKYKPEKCSCSKIKVDNILKKSIAVDTSLISLGNKGKCFENEECCLNSKKNCKKINDSTQTDSSKSTQCDMDLDISNTNEQEDLDKKIMYVLLEGLVQNEKEEAEEEQRKRTKAIQANKCEMEKCPIHQDVEKQKRFNSSKFAGKFEAIPEEDLVAIKGKNKSPRSYLMFKSKSHSCNHKNEIGEKAQESVIKHDDPKDVMKKEVAKYEDYLINKKKSTFYIEKEQPSLNHEVIQECVEAKHENRRHSLYGNSSLDISKTNCRRHTVHGNNSTVLNYKRAMMVGTFTPFNPQEEGGKGKQALTGEQEELMTLSKGWINFYLLRGPDSQEFFSDPDDECIFSPDLEMHENYFRDKEKPSESFNVKVESKLEPVLPNIQNKTVRKPIQDKKVVKTKSASLPKLNLRPAKPIPKPFIKKENNRKSISDAQKPTSSTSKPKRILNGDIEKSNVNSPIQKARQPQVKSQKIEGDSIEITEVSEQCKAERNGLLKQENREALGPLREVDTPVDSYVSSPHLEELDPMEYENSIRTISSVSARSESDDCQKQIVKQSDKPTIPPRQGAYSENNWTVTVAGKSSNCKQAPPNIELHLSVNSSEQSREQRSNKRQSNRMNFSLTLKNSYADSDMSSGRPDNCYEKDKKNSDSSGLYEKKSFKKLTQNEEANGVRSFTTLSFHDIEDKEDSLSTKRDAQEGLLSVTGSFITPEKRRKPPTMSEKDISLYKNSKKRDTDNF